MNIEPTKNDMVYITDASGNPYLEFSPKDDMTPIESVRMAQLFATKMIGSFVDVDWYLEKHNLLRHFKEINETQCN